MQINIDKDVIIYQEYLLYSVDKISICTNTKLKEPGTLIHTYRCLQILSQNANTILRYPILTSNTLWFLIVIICNILLIHLNLRIPVIGLFSVAAGSGFGTAVIAIVYSSLGDMNTKSKSLMKWKYDIQIRREDRLVLTKYLNSCRSLRLDYGSFGYHQKSTTALMILKLITYNVKALIITRRYFK